MQQNICRNLICNDKHPMVLEFFLEGGAFVKLGNTPKKQKICRSPSRSLVLGVGLPL